MEIILYSRNRCPLCVEAKEILELCCETMELTYQEVDIHSDDTLLEKYQLMIPVVVVDGEEALYGKIAYSALKKCLVDKINSAR
jgi:glutaredoxin